MRWTWRQSHKNNVSIAQSRRHALQLKKICATLKVSPAFQSLSRDAMLSNKHTALIGMLEQKLFQSLSRDAMLSNYEKAKGGRVNGTEFQSLSRDAMLSNKDDPLWNVNAAFSSFNRSVATPCSPTMNLSQQIGYLNKMFQSLSRDAMLSN